MKLVYDGGETWVTEYRKPESYKDWRAAAEYPDDMARRYFAAKKEYEEALRAMNDFFYSEGHKQLPELP